MQPLPLTSELAHVSRRTVWFKPPEEALDYPEHFIAHVLTYGMFGDVQTLRKYVSDDDLREALAHAPAGVFDARSWAYWHIMLGQYPAPPMPVRKFN
jgi:hypothetical protein